MYDHVRSKLSLAETTRETIEQTFNKFLQRGDVGLIIINQPVADQIRPTITNHRFVAYCCVAATMMLMSWPHSTGLPDLNSTNGVVHIPVLAESRSQWCLKYLRKTALTTCRRTRS